MFAATFASSAVGRSQQDDKRHCRFDEHRQGAPITCAQCKSCVRLTVRFVFRTNASIQLSFFADDVVDLPLGQNTRHHCPRLELPLCSNKAKSKIDFEPCRDDRRREAPSLAIVSHFSRTLVAPFSACSSVAQTIALLSLAILFLHFQARQKCLLNVVE